MYPSEALAPVMTATPYLPLGRCPRLCCRLLFGIAGGPGSGKSTLAREVSRRVNAAAGAELAVVVPMDGEGAALGIRGMVLCSCKVPQPPGLCGYPCHGRGGRGLHKGLVGWTEVTVGLVLDGQQVHLLDARRLQTLQYVHLLECALC